MRLAVWRPKFPFVHERKRRAPVLLVVRTVARTSVCIGTLLFCLRRQKALPKNVTEDRPDLGQHQFVRAQRDDRVPASAKTILVDAVFTYVNGSEPHFVAELARYSKIYSKKKDATRYRDVGQLRYGMRSVWQHAPWIRKIFLLVSDREHQVPFWLNTSNPDIVIVEHADIWTDPSRLPVFNSVAIELHLHRLPGVAPNILYFNDDVALTSRLQPYEHLWSAPGKQILYEAWDAPRSKWRDIDAYGESLLSVSRAFDRQYGRRRVRKVYAHVPFLMNTTIQKDVLAEWGKAVENTLNHSRFRHGFDFAVQFSYSQYMQQKRRPDGKNAFDYSIVDAGSRILQFEELKDSVEENARMFKKILSNPRLFLCIQDKMIDPSERVISDTVHFYDTLLPVKAPWEIDYRGTREEINGAQQNESSTW